MICVQMIMYGRAASANAHKHVQIFKYTYCLHIRFICKLKIGFGILSTFKIVCIISQLFFNSDNYIVLADACTVLVNTSIL